jgi:hypothetical protein
MDKNLKSHSDRRKIYNSDKTSIQICKKTHEKLKSYCDSNNLKIKSFIEEIILKSINTEFKK